MADQRRKYYSSNKRRELTPAELGIIERRRRIANKCEHRNRNTAIAVIVTIAIAATSACVWYFGYVKPYDNYDAQMRIGFEKFGIKRYGEAEAAFRNALSKRPNDPDATVALADTFAAEGLYNDAIVCMKALQGIDDMDTRSYERLIAWYVDGSRDIAAANDQIITAYEKQLALASDAIRPAPVFSPDPGDYSEPEKISIRADAGLSIYFSTDGSIPSAEGGRKYEGKLDMPNNQSVTYIAASYDRDGLMSWPATAKYSLSIIYKVDTSAFGHIGHTARAIMDDVGPLYYGEGHGNSYYYNDDNKIYHYVFPKKYFTVVQNVAAPPATDVTGAPATGEAASGGDVDVNAAPVPPAPTTTEVAIDPETNPLPPDAVCSAISMKAADYIIGMDGEIGVDDFMAGIGVDSYKVDLSDADGAYHLTYSTGGRKYDMALKDKNTISPGKELLVRKK
ncbi:MAG: chitobiase/beta-hexosaminidase C-terminal domain-containing protein [Clostridiales Family XIII bacterium]|nr:chitobiase/beta-hexosaminidase C-terminal domain-containing protein [Clostridiales Family XIII bacterium]